MREYEVNLMQKKGEIDSVNVNDARKKKPFTSLKEFGEQIWSQVPTEEVTREDTEPIFRDLAILPRKYGVDLEVFDPENNKWIIVPHRSTNEVFPPDTTLVIAEPVKFIEKYLNFSKKLKKNDTWDKRVSPDNIMWNATPDDFLHPERFLDKLTYQAEHRLFTHYDKWKTLGNSLVGDEEIHVRYMRSEGFFESPHTLHIALSSGKPGPTDEISLVRYGVVAPKTAAVYAVQMPLIDEVSPSRVQEAKSFVTQVMEIARKRYKERGYTLSEFPPIEDFFQGNSQIGIQEMIDLLARTMTIQISDASGTEISEPDEKLQATAYILSEFLIGLMPIFNKYGKFRPIEAMFKQRSERMKRLNTVFKQERKSRREDIPSGPTLSLSLFCILAQEKGIEEVIIPTLFPLRLHEDDVIDSRIMLQMEKSLSSVCSLVEGISIISYPEGDGNYHLKLDTTLSSSNPTLKNMIEGINNSSRH